MKCEHCGKNEATFFCRSTINGHTAQVHLCDACAAQLGYTRQIRRTVRPGFFDPFSLLSDFGMMPMRMLTEFPAAMEEAEEAPLDIVQPEEAPEGLLPPEELAKLRQERERNALESQLKNAIDEERYEDAAKLRDQLGQLPQA